MPNTFKITDLARIGGEARFLVYHDGRKVIDSFFISRAPIRGFEKLMVGKNPIFAIEAAMRICGICHAAHGIAAVEAIENSVGIAPPPNGIYLREIIGLLNRIQSHIVHMIFITRDLLRENMAEQMIRREIKLLVDVSNLLTRFGGAPTHPPYIVLGGVQSLPKERYIEDSNKKLKGMRDEFYEINNIFFDEQYWSEKASLLSQMKVQVKYLASHPFYGDRYNINVDEVTAIRYEKFRRKEEVPEDVKKTTSLIALYRGDIVEVGPRARLSLYGRFKDDSLLGIQRARLMEIVLAIDRILELLANISLTEPPKTPTIIFRRGVGIAVYEAPRGTLIHNVEIDSEGRIAKYRIIVPTMFNIPVMEKASVGVPIECADVVPRLYDPCIPCSTHLIRVNNG